MDLISIFQTTQTLVDGKYTTIIGQRSREIGTVISFKTMNYETGFIFGSIDVDVFAFHDIKGTE
jgi:hypothetical protein